MWTQRTSRRHSCKDTAGISVRSELEKHGFLGVTPSSFDALPISAHFEVHIEQGPLLCDESNGAPVGLVKGVQGFRWIEVEIKGRTQHAATPMNRRLDPLRPFATFALAAERLAIEYGGAVTIGRLGSCEAQSTNCVLPSVLFHIDVRHHRLESLNDLTEALQAALRDAATMYGEPGWNVLHDCDPVNFAERAVGAVRRALVKRPQWEEHELISGAGHDS